MDDIAKKKILEICSKIKQGTPFGGFNYGELDEFIDEIEELVALILEHLK